MREWNRESLAIRITKRHKKEEEAGSARKKSKDTETTAVWHLKKTGLRQKEKTTHSARL
jgi:hypothetical protein